MRALQWVLVITLVFIIGYMVGATSRAESATRVATSGGETGAPADSARGHDAAASSAPSAGSDGIASSGAPPAQQGSAIRGDIPDVGSAAALQVLSSELIVPLADVDVSKIPDTFDAPRVGHTHHALDISAPRGTPVRSAAPGRLLKLHDSKAGGLMVYAADSTARFILMYGHLDHYADGLREGAPLTRGEVIGYVGTTGNAAPNAPHLHFAIASNENVAEWWKGTAVDPWPLLARAEGAHPADSAPRSQRRTTAR